MAHEFFSLFDRLCYEVISCEGILRSVDCLIGCAPLPDEVSRSMFRYAIDVDHLAATRMKELLAERRKEFICMTLQLARDGFYPPQLWAHHFLASNDVADDSPFEGRNNANRNSRILTGGMAYRFQAGDFAPEAWAVKG
ncbi:hypothetical protein [Paracoccus seriniphilus]|uniref:hypothetical protein n=1 Tax=Paracoccus seriniphilus TaxID=184748 RepID=UPI003561D41F